MNKKADYQQIHEYINELMNRPWLGPSQRWWPKFILSACGNITSS